LSDISRVENFDQKRINSFFVEGRELFVATDFGIVIYDLDNLLVKDSFTKIGSFTRGITVFDIKIFEGGLYAGTQEGIGIGDLNENLLIEENWTNFDESNGFVSRSVRALAVTPGVVYASTSEENYEYDGISWSLSNDFTLAPITSYAVQGNILWGIDNERIYKLEETQLQIQSVNIQRLQALLPASNSVAVGTLNNGIGFLDEGTQNLELRTPAGPYRGVNFKICPAFGY